MFILMSIVSAFLPTYTLRVVPGSLLKEITERFSPTKPGFANKIDEGYVTTEGMDTALDKALDIALDTASYKVLAGKTLQGAPFLQALLSQEPSRADLTLEVVNKNNNDTIVGSYHWHKPFDFEFVKREEVLVPRSLKDKRSVDFRFDIADNLPEMPEIDPYVQAKSGTPSYFPITLNNLGYYPAGLYYRSIYRAIKHAAEDKLNSVPLEMIYRLQDASVITNP